MTIKTAYLRDRGVLRVAGEDATSFLQGLLTNDVESLAIGEARYAALLTPQGKILFDFLVLRLAAETGAAFFLDCPAAQAADLAKRLGFYRLRAKVTISDESADRAVAAGWAEKVAQPDFRDAVVGTSPAMTEEGEAAKSVSYADPRDPRLGSRTILPRAAAQAIGEANLADYEAHRIALGVPKGGADFAYADVFPHDANLDLLHGVDFEKGCYVGQEVVSRMRHRGGVRKRILRLALAGLAPAAGTPVLAGETSIGALGSSAGNAALAMLRVDRVEEARAAGRSFTAAGVVLEIESG
jgi:folate-binding protein YgfZ